jgi:ADP-ribosylglycohydrolase
MSLPSDHESRLARARASLEGLSVGDAFGDLFFRPDAEERVKERSLPPGPWPWTDDTQMALSIFYELQHGTTDQERLASNFANHYEPGRGYGPSMHGQLQSVRAGMPWSVAATSQFDGAGSYGNGAAMRVAPVGSYFADDLEAVVQQAILSSEVTHSHPEGIAGGIAVAVAAAIAARLSGSPAPTRADFIDAVLPYIPDSDVWNGIRRARDLPPESTVNFAVVRLGNGHQVSAQDTVPFCLWCAGEWLSHYEEAMWRTVSGYGDRDTTCAIVGSIVAAYASSEAIPPGWTAAREKLPDWPFA